LPGSGGVRAAPAEESSTVAPLQWLPPRSTPTRQDVAATDRPAPTAGAGGSGGGFYDNGTARLTNDTIAANVTAPAAPAAGIDLGAPFTAGYLVGAGGASGGGGAIEAEALLDDVFGRYDDHTEFDGRNGRRCAATGTGNRRPVRRRRRGGGIDSSTPRLYETSTLDCSKQLTELRGRTPRRPIQPRLLRHHLPRDHANPM